MTAFVTKSAICRALRPALGQPLLISLFLWLTDSAYLKSVSTAHDQNANRPNRVHQQPQSCEIEMKTLRLAGETKGHVTLERSPYPRPLVFFCFVVVCLLVDGLVSLKDPFLPWSGQGQNHWCLYPEQTPSCLSPPTPACWCPRCCSEDGGPGCSWSQVGGRRGWGLPRALRSRLCGGEWGNSAATPGVYTMARFRDRKTSNKSGETKSVPRSWLKQQ